MLWKLVGGRHKEGGKLYQKGDLIETARDLGTQFPNKFERLPDPTPAAVAAHAPVALPAAAPAPVVPPTPPAPPAAPVKPLGADVTADWPAAAKPGLLVFQEGKTYHVTDVDNPTTALNPEPLSKKEVGPFLDSYAAG